MRKDAMVLTPKQARLWGVSFIKLLLWNVQSVTRIPSFQGGSILTILEKSS